DDLSAALAETDGRIVVKTPRGGYDAHGVRIVDGPDQADDRLAAHGALLAEEPVPLTRARTAPAGRRPAGGAGAHPPARSAPPAGGSDAHGVRTVDGPARADDWLAAHGELLAQALVPFTRELSAQVARRPGGEAVAYPVVQSVQKDGVCYEVVAPAPGLDEAA